MNMKPIELTVDLSEKKKEEPKTLADVEPFVACVQNVGDVKYVVWRTDSDDVVTVGEDGVVFVDSDEIDNIKVSRVLGPIRIKFIL